MRLDENRRMLQRYAGACVSALHVNPAARLCSWNELNHAVNVIARQQSLAGRIKSATAELLALERGIYAHVVMQHEGPLGGQRSRRRNI